MRLSFASRRQGTLHVGFILMRFVGFRMSPKNQIHDRDSLIQK
jgi:hypothetical protein